MECALFSFTIFNKGTCLQILAEIPNTNFTKILRPLEIEVAQGRKQMGGQEKIKTRLSNFVANVTENYLQEKCNLSKWKIEIFILKKHC